MGLSPKKKKKSFDHKFDVICSNMNVSKTLFYFFFNLVLLGGFEYEISHLTLLREKIFKTLQLLYG